MEGRVNTAGGNVDRILLQISEPVERMGDVHMHIAYCNISSV